MEDHQSNIDGHATDSSTYRTCALDVWTVYQQFTCKHVHSCDSSIGVGHKHDGVLVEGPHRLGGLRGDLKGGPGGEEAVNVIHKGRCHCCKAAFVTLVCLICRIVHRA